MIKPNIKALYPQVSEEKNFKDGILRSYVPTCDPQVGPILTLGASYEQIW